VIYYLYFPPRCLDNEQLFSYLFTAYAKKDGAKLQPVFSVGGALQAAERVIIFSMRRYGLWQSK
jgi:hypothetical protein